MPQYKPPPPPKTSNKRISTKIISTIVSLGCLARVSVCRL
jgi:hypothetical protein